MVGLLHQPLHVIIDFNHLLVCAFNVVSNLVKLGILVGRFSLEVLGLVLDHVGGSQNFIDFFVLLIYVSLLLFKDLTVVQISSVVVFAILSAGAHHGRFLIRRVAEFVIQVQLVLGLRGVCLLLEVHNLVDSLLSGLHVDVETRA